MVGLGKGSSVNFYKSTFVLIGGMLECAVDEHLYYRQYYEEVHMPSVLCSFSTAVK